MLWHQLFNVLIIYVLCSPTDKLEDLDVVFSDELFTGTDDVDFDIVDDDDWLYFEDLAILASSVHFF